MDIYNINGNKHYDMAEGTTLACLAEQIFPDGKINGQNVLAALVDHRLKELSFKMMIPHEVEFIGYDHPDGRRTYVRSVCFVLQKAVRELFPSAVLIIDYALPSGLYCELRSPALTGTVPGEVLPVDAEGSGK